jgi:hypothetical protein
MAQSYFYPRNMLGVISPVQQNFPPVETVTEVNVDSVQEAYIERKDK